MPTIEEWRNARTRAADAAIQAEAHYREGRADMPTPTETPIHEPTETEPDNPEPTPDPVEEDATDDVTDVLDTSTGKVDVVSYRGGEMVPVGDAQIATVGDMLARMTSLSVDDSEEIAARIAAKKLSARSVDELNKIGTLDELASILNIPHLIQDVHWNKSTIDGKESAYAVFDAVNVFTGEVKTIGCGHQDVMITIYKAIEWGLIPCEMIFTKANNNNRFNKPTYLAKIEPPRAAP